MRFYGSCNEKKMELRKEAKSAVLRARLVARKVVAVHVVVT